MTFRVYTLKTPASFTNGDDSAFQPRVLFKSWTKNSTRIGKLSLSFIQLSEVSQILHSGFQL